MLNMEERWKEEIEKGKGQEKMAELERNPFNLQFINIHT